MINHESTGDIKAYSVVNNCMLTRKMISLSSGASLNSLVASAVHVATAEFLYCPWC